ncbi:hypothetical protein L914_05949 [Phytophthora nicotianae]|uniref:Uncharacterized protein n=1 Tax=Phytophthora nicotianae TaxID=4792 RepID=W2NPN7_PHYNI|nr:hypothetical protein L914_05949 [Phytophthora nicotianae]
MLFDKTVLNFNDFVSQLAHQLVFNEHTMKRSLRSNTISDGNEETAHTLKAFCDLPQYAEARTTVICWCLWPKIPTPVLQ